MITAGYLAIAMWASFVFGGAAKTVIADHQTAHGHATICQSTGLGDDSPVSYQCRQVTTAELEEIRIKNTLPAVRS